jgi:hypothetical protein
MAATGLAGAAATALLQQLHLAPTLRPEALLPQDFARLLRASRSL